MARTTRRGVGIAALCVCALAATGCLPGPLITIETPVGTGTAGYTGDGGPATAAGLYDPAYATVGPDGSLYVSETGTMRIRRVDPAGTITTVAGNGLSNWTGDGGPATDAALSAPHGLGFDAAGNLYVAEFNNHIVRRIDPAGTITTVAGTGTVGGGGSGGYSGDGGPAVDAELRFPAGLAVAPDGTFFVSDLNHTIRRVTPDGIITTVAGTGAEGFGGDGGPATDALLRYPAGLALDAAGVLYVADQGNHRVRRIVPGGAISTIAGTGQSGRAGDWGPATAARLGDPAGLAVDREGNLLVSQPSFRVVRSIVLGGGVILPFAGSGATTGGPGDGGHPGAARLNQPYGLAVDAAGDAYIVDPGTDVVRFVRTGATVGGVVDVAGGDRAGIPVQLYDEGDLASPVAATVTDANGEWSFQVPVGTYVVRFVSEGSRVGEWWDDSADGAGATPIVLGRGSRVRADATLDLL